MFLWYILPLTMMIFNQGEACDTNLTDATSILCANDRMYRHINRLSEPPRTSEAEVLDIVIRCCDTQCPDSEVIKICYLELPPTPSPLEEYRRRRRLRERQRLRQRLAELDDY